MYPMRYFGVVGQRLMIHIPSNSLSIVLFPTKIKMQESGVGIIHHNNFCISVHVLKPGFKT
jgi:hypothetical protein